MSGDFWIPAPPMTAWEIDHLDPWDNAETLAELLEERQPEVEVDEYVEPFSQREYRAMAARHDAGPARVHPR